MKKIIDYIFKHAVTFALGLIVVFLLLSGAISKCSSKQIDDTIEQVDINSLRRHLVDSIETEQHQKYISYIDSINAIREAENKKNKKVIAGLDKENIKLRKEVQDIYNENDTLDLESCKKVVEKQEDIIENRDSVVEKQDEQISTYKMTLTDLNLKYESQLNETVRTQEMYKSCGSDNDKLKKQLEKQNTWWKRNEKWMFLGAGIIGTTLLLK